MELCYRLAVLRRGRGVIRSLLVIGALVASSAPVLGTAGGARWDLRDLHPEVRSRVHLRASDVPRFPHGDPALMDPRRWPKRMTIQGRRCVLNVQAVVQGRSAMRPRALESLDPNAPFTLFYTPARGASREQLGPVYFWGSRGHLVDRRWIEVRDGFRVTYEYGYHDSGRLFRYAVGRVSETPSARGGRGRKGPEPGIRSERFSEFFDRKGRLEGAGYSRVDSDDERTVEVYYKDGKRIGYPAFEREAESPERSSGGE